jgi:hypothetical protein
VLATILTSEYEPSHVRETELVLNTLVTRLVMVGIYDVDIGIIVETIPDAVVVRGGYAEIVKNAYR